MTPKDKLTLDIFGAPIVIGDTVMFSFGKENNIKWYEARVLIIEQKVKNSPFKYDRLIRVMRQNEDSRSMTKNNSVFYEETWSSIVNSRDVICKTQITKLTENAFTEYLV